MIYNLAQKNHCPFQPVSFCNPGRDSAVVHYINYKSNQITTSLLPSLYTLYLSQGSNNGILDVYISVLRNKL